VVTRQLHVERRIRKVRRSQTDVLPLCHATSHLGVYWTNLYQIFRIDT